jgi:hypothetical protein
MFINDYERIKEVFMNEQLQIPVVPDGYVLWVDLNTVDNGTNYRFEITDPIIVANIIKNKTSMYQIIEKEMLPNKEQEDLDSDEPFILGEEYVYPYDT